MNACGDGVHVGRNRPCFQLLPMGDVPTATQLSNADMEWLDFAWYLGIEESEYVDLMYHLQHSRGDDIFNIFQHEDLDDDDNLDDIDNVPYIADDEDDLSDIEEEPGPGGEVGFNQDLDEDNNMMDGGSDERSRDLGLDFEEGTNGHIGWWSEFDDTDIDSDVENNRDTNDAAVIEEDPLPGNMNSWDPGDGRIDENTRGPNSGDSSNPNNVDSGHSRNYKTTQNCPGRNAGSDTVVAEEEPLPCSSKKRSREMDEQEPEASCSKRFRWCSEFDDHNSDGSLDDVFSGDFSDPNSASADSGHRSNIKSCHNPSDRNTGTEEESSPAPSKKRSREENEASEKRLRSLNQSEMESAESTVVVEEDPQPGRSRRDYENSPHFSDSNAGSEAAVAEELPAPSKRKYEQDSEARRSKLFKCCNQFVDSDSDSNMVHANVLCFCHPNSADLCNTPTPLLRHAGSDAEEEPLSASKKRSREQNEGSNKRFSCLVELNESDSDSDTASVNSAADATEHLLPGNTDNPDSGSNRSDGNTQYDALNTDHANSRASSVSNSSRYSGNGRNTLNHPDRRACPSAVVAENELPTLPKMRLREDNEGSNRRFRWVIEFDVGDGDMDSVYSAVVAEEDPVPGYMYSRLCNTQGDSLNTDHASSRASRVPMSSGAGYTDDHPFRNTHSKAVVAEEEALPALSWKRSRVEDEDSDAISSKRVRWCNEFDDQHSDGSTDTTHSEYSNSLGRYKNCQNHSLRNAGFDAVVTEDEFLLSATRKRSRERDEQDSEASSSKIFRSLHELDDGDTDDGVADGANTGHYSNKQYRPGRNAGSDFAEAGLLSAPFKKRSREKDEQDSDTSNNKFRWCDEFNDTDSADLGAEVTEENLCLAHPGKPQEGMKEPFRLCCWSCRGKASAKSNPNEIKKAE
ncbi:hypothetical protein JOB18_037435 [Solea senegalensis]|uniref:Uncharacterized protein n=1 Tax=Solea senegalensis TaxID=28829 RepID=A0AAV6QRG6_SOLSE|nr:dentin sialophosphoprotein-like [Solea senegalensis]KAG7494776.1 hypothetical protein JOB18_037435 [Solea senegalensis]